jgi:glycosyltransferase involved in cell wall biosynthesis
MQAVTHAASSGLWHPRLQEEAMRAVCIVNNYNYERYLTTCLDSALRQSRPFDLILVVDVGSTHK